MANKNQFRYSSLAWVKKEVDHSLESARHAILSYLELDNPQYLHTAMDLLRDVLGTLEVADIHGGALLAQECLILVQAIANDEVKHPAEAVQPVVKALLQLPDYLEFVQREHQDVPVVLVTIINDLRASRDASLLSDSVIDFPALDTEAEKQVLMSGDTLKDSSEKLARALRHIFQLGLLGWYRGKSVEGSLLKMAAVCKRLRDSSKQLRARRLWWLAQGFSEALHSGLLESSPAVKMLMGRIDRQIRLLVEHGEDAFAEEIPPALIHNLLFYLAGTGDDNLTVNQIKSTYLPEGGLPGDDTLSAARTSVHGPNNLLFQAVSQAVAEDIAGLKDKLEIYERSADKSALDVGMLLPPLKRLGDTLGMLGLGYGREQVLSEVEMLEQSSDGAFDLERLAGVLIEVEQEVMAFGEDGRRQLALAGDSASSAPDSHSESLNFSRTKVVAINEIKVDLQTARDSIERYIEGHFDWTYLGDLPRLIGQIEGVATALADSSLESFSAEFVRVLRGVKDAQPKALNEQDLDDLADVVESIDFYLDNYAETGLAFEHLLFPGQQALSRLGLRWGALAVDEASGEDQSEVQKSSVAPAVPYPEDLDFDELSETGSLTLADFNLDETFLGETELGMQTEPSDPVQVIDRDELASQQGLTLSEETEAGFTRVLELDSEAPETLDEIDVSPAEDVLPSPDDVVTLSGTFGQESQTLLENDPAQELVFDADDLTLSETDDGGISLSSDEAGDAVFASSLVDESSEGEEQVFALDGSDEGEESDSSGDVPVLEEPPADRELEIIDESPDLHHGIAEEDESEQIDVSPLTLIDAGQDLGSGFKALDSDFILDSGSEAESGEDGVDSIEQAEESRSHLELVGSAFSADFEDSNPSVSGGENIPEDSSQEVAASSPLDGFQVLPDDIDEEIYEIFLEELNEEYEHIKNSLPLWIDSPSDHEHLLQIRRSWHTLKGSGRLVGAEVVGEFAWAHEELLNRVLDGQIPADDEVLDCVRVGTRMLPTLIEQLKTRTHPDKDAGDQVIRAQALSLGHRVDNSQGAVESTAEPEVVEAEEPQEHKAEQVLDASGVAAPAPSVEVASEPSEVPEAAEPHVEEEAEVAEASGEGSAEPSVAKPRLEPVLFDIFNAECLQHLDTVEVFVEKAKAEEGDALPSMDLVRSIHTINGSARTADVPEIYEVSTAMERFLDRLSSVQPDANTGLPELLENYARYVREVLKALADGSAMPESAPVHAGINEALDRLASQSGVPASSTPVSTGVAPDLVEDQDAELVEVFLEECREILDHCEIAMSRWQNNPEDLASLSELRRELHTLKGGARMAGFRHLGNLSHAVENLLAVVVEGQRAPDELFLSGVHMGFDQIHSMAEAARKHRPIYPADMAMAVLKKIRDGAALEPNERELLKIGGELVQVPSVDAGEQPEKAETKVDRSSVPMAAMVAESPSPEAEKPVPAAPSSSSGQLESVRVRSDVLDELVNHVGEVNVFQSRIEQQLGSISFNLQEFEQTVARLGEQLRRMEMETEAQILFRHDSEPQDPDTTAVQQMFDPLELDRYSNIQQLSRSLKESTSDLQNIHALLAEQTVQLESLQQQQSRISNELQEGLMRTRMVQFSVMIPRLRRVVRQTAMELGKEVELVFKGESNDMDRKVLDSMIVPLEHMLRNAVAHGIEFPDERTKAGKPSKGTIEVSLSRDGPEIVITISDDGMGIDTQTVLEKAQAKGMIDAGATLTDAEIFSLILEPGFTTAKEVSQIAGRGVGMDVVNSQIKALNGAMDISSVPGKGANFRIHLPISLAITQALLVRAREHLYAVPLSSIEGVIQLSGAFIREQFSRSNPQVEYAGTVYDLKQLAAAMEHTGVVLGDDATAQPVLLTQVADRNVAFHVDSLEGNREVVVKSVGPLMDSLVGVSGGTILPDGRVVLILDMAGLVRSRQIVDQVVELAEKPESKEVDQPPVVMVVDDSITIRRVTERMLERNKYQVVTAKDGVDAIEKLQATIPDVMLLDIEMPRMDGFELASHIRNTPAYKEVPIIMITSRTGKKHKDQALGLGVNRFLGKPYQESVLLETIEAMLAGKEEGGASHAIH